MFAIDKGNDGSLVEGCLRDDADAWQAFRSKYSPLIRSAICIRMKKYGVRPSRIEVDEIFQNVLICLWKDRKLSEVKNRGDIKCWLAVVSGNTAIDYFRKKTLKKELKTVSIHEEIDGMEIGEFLNSGNTDSSKHVIDKETAMRIKDLIGSLPEKERLIMKLYILYDKKYNEISDVTGIPFGTVANYIKRAKDKLREGLKNYL